MIEKCACFVSIEGRLTVQTQTYGTSITAQLTFDTTKFLSEDQSNQQRKASYLFYALERAL